MLDDVSAFAHMVALTDIGPRVSGSAEEQAGIDYVASRLRESGLVVETPDFPIRRWREDVVAVRAGNVQIEATAVPFAGTLPKGEHRLPVAYIEGGAEFDVAQAGDLAGKAWLMARDAYIHYPDTALVERLGVHNPAALIFTASPGHRGVPVVFYNFRDSDRMPAPPCLVISHDDMARLVAEGAAELTVALEAEVVNGNSRNVVGTLKGEQEDEIIVVCAHHDSAPTSPGACDNAGGCATVLELARVFAAGPKPRRTIHFCTWGSHETGMHGSEAYIRAAQAAGRSVVAAINFDTIGMTVGEDRVNILGGPAWNRLMDSIVEGTGIEPVVQRGPGFTDYTNFGAAGIPAVSVAQSYFNFNHTPFDSIDRCSPRGLIKPLAMGKALLDAILEAADHRQDFSETQRREVQSFNGRWGWSNFTPLLP